MSLPPHHEPSDGGDEGDTVNGPAMSVTLPASLLELDLTTLQDLLRRTSARMQNLRNVAGAMSSTVELIASSRPFGDECDDDEEEYRPPRSSRQRARRWDHSPETLRIERDLDIRADQENTVEQQLRIMPSNEHRRRQRARRMYIPPDFIRRARENLEDDKELMAAFGKVADVDLSYEGMIHMAHGYFGAEEVVNERDVRYINGFGFSGELNAQRGLDGYLSAVDREQWRIRQAEDQRRRQQQQARQQRAPQHHQRQQRIDRQYEQTTSGEQRRGSGQP